MNRITAKLSDLAKIPSTLLEKELEKENNSEYDKKKLYSALNLRLMRTLSNTSGMFGYRNY